jgi:hypothetical protein
VHLHKNEIVKKHSQEAEEKLLLARVLEKEDSRKDINYC